jgi:CelD/BcsL family acetyltransferase involved in cellulose biosynthesis
MSLAVDLLTSDAELFALRPPWETLWRRVGGTTPFQSPAWLLPWWRQFGTGRPRVAVLRAGDELAGVLPLYVLDECGERKLLPLGVGISDYCSALLDPRLPGDTITALLGAALALAREDGVTICDLPNVPQGCGLCRIEAPRGWMLSRHEGEACPLLRVPDGAWGLANVIPPRMARKLRMNRHRAERAGGWTVESASPATVPLFLDELFRLHDARSGMQGRALIDARVRAFHHEAAPELLETGALRLQIMRIRGAAVAACYGLLAGPDRMLFYLSGFDPSHAFESPGTILLGAMLEEAIAEGRRKLDFLRGREAYKYAWGGVDQLGVALRLEPP